MTTKIVKTQKLKLWQSQNLNFEEKKLSSYCDKNLSMANLHSWRFFLKSVLVRTFWHLDNRRYVLWAAFCDSRDVYWSKVNFFVGLIEVWWYIQQTQCSRGFSTNSFVTHQLSDWVSLFLQIFTTSQIPNHKI